MDNNRYNYRNPQMGWGPMWPFVAPWMQVMQAWTCALSAFAPMAPQQPWDPYATYGAAGAAAPAATLPKVSVKVTSQSPTEVSACVDRGADAMRLTADPLKTQQEGYAPLPLESIKIVCESGHVRVAVTIPTDQPAGRYTGAIRDGVGNERGELTVTIWNPKSPTHPSSV
jgi:hypothetical protein